MAKILDTYSTELPSQQNALNIFEGDWTSRLPTPWDHLRAGSTPLFEDPRAEWAVRQLGGVQDLDVLELGPLEAGHSYFLERRGARSVLAIEGNMRAYLRCLVVKEILGFRAVRFLCGDFREFLRTTDRNFDLVFASGVLYHMTDPVQLIADIARVTRRVYLWTHYYDAEIVGRNEVIHKRLSKGQPRENQGFAYKLHSYDYDIALGWTGFCGGAATSCAWLPREAILGALAHFGFDKVDISFEDPNHPNGPCFSLAATRTAR